jgi:hypothetical protein
VASSSNPRSPSWPAVGRQTVRKVANRRVSSSSSASPSTANTEMPSSGSPSSDQPGPSAAGGCATCPPCPGRRALRSSSQAAAAQRAAIPAGRSSALACGQASDRQCQSPALPGSRTADLRGYVAKLGRSDGCPYPGHLRPRPSLQNTPARLQTIGALVSSLRGVGRAGGSRGNAGEPGAVATRTS